MQWPKASTAFPRSAKKAVGDACIGTARTTIAELGSSRQVYSHGCAASTRDLYRIEEALHRATIAFADELRIGGLSDDMAWRAADRAIGAASDFLAKEVRL